MPDDQYGFDAERDAPDSWLAARLRLARAWHELAAPIVADINRRLARFLRWLDAALRRITERNNDA